MATGMGMAGSALGRVGAYSATLGPLLAAAFPVALIGLAAFAVVHVYEELRKLGMQAEVNAEAWQKINHESTAAMESATTEIDRLDERLAELTSGKMAALQMEMLHIGDGAVAMSGRLSGLFDRMGTQLSKEVSTWEKIKEFVTWVNNKGLSLPDQGEAAKAFGSALSETLDTKGLAAGIDLVNAQIVKLNGLIAKNPDDQGMKEYADQLIRVQGLLEEQVTLEDKKKQVNQAEQGKEATEASQKALEEFNKEQEREGKEAEEAAVKRGNAEREAADAKERVDEEMAASSAEMAKHDLESWRSALVAKTALTEEQGKAQLAQIRANAELSEKVTAQHKGAGSPEIKNEAFAAYQQEVMAIQQLIAAEDQLQQKLKATGAAADDPKVLDSQKRQLELTQQMNAAMNAYLGTVHKVDEAWTADVTKAVNGVSAEFSRGVVSWMNGQQTFGRAMQHVWTSFADTVVSSLIKAGAQMIAQAALQKSISKSSQLSAAETAASNTWASVSAIPIIGPFLAPEAAAAAFAGVLAFDSGGMVPGYGPVPAIVHGGEMILNQSQQKALGSSGDTFHYHAGAGADTEQTRASSKEFFKLAKRELRRRSR